MHASRSVIFWLAALSMFHPKTIRFQLPMVPTQVFLARLYFTLFLLSQHRHQQRQRGFLAH